MELEGVLVSFGVEAVAALFLGASLAGLSRWYPSPVLTYWAVGWGVAAVASVASLVSLLSVVGATAVPRSISTPLFMVGVLGQGVLQVEGVRRLTWRGAGSIGFAIAVAAVVGYALAAMALTPNTWSSPQRQVFRVMIPYGINGAGFIASGVLIRVLAGSGGLGRLLLPITLVAYGAQSVFTGVVGGGMLEPPANLVLFSHLSAMLLVAFAIPLWFLEEERAALKAAQERERAVQERLSQGQRLEALGQLAAGVAHDFNNLLTVVGAHAEMILMEDPPAHVRESAKEISEAKRRGAGLVVHLMTFARRRPVAPSNLSLRDEVDRLESMLRPLLNESIGLDVVHAAAETPVMVEGEQLERVVMNLVLNARDAIGDRGRITLRTGVVSLHESLVIDGAVVPPGRWCTLTVEDDGQGMASGVKDRIFDPFFTTKVRDRGTGLGLATVYGVIEEAGGRILVESRVGRGTTFTILLPHHPG